MIVISLSIPNSVVTIGLEETSITVLEEETVVEVCANLTSVSLETDAEVTLATADGTAMGKCAQIYFLNHRCSED